MPSLFPNLKSYFPVFQALKNHKIHFFFKITTFWTLAAVAVLQQLFTGIKPQWYSPLMKLRMLLQMSGNMEYIINVKTCMSFWINDWKDILRNKCLGILSFSYLLRFSVIQVIAVLVSLLKATGLLVDFWRRFVSHPRGFFCSIFFLYFSTLCCWWCNPYTTSFLMLTKEKWICLLLI